jgi:hypothetical protein
MRQESIMNGVGNVSNVNNSQGASLAGQPKPSSGQFDGMPVKQAQEPSESPLKKTNPYPPGSETPSIGTPVGTPRATETAATGKAQESAAPTNIQVSGSAEFRQRVAKDLANFAPGTTIDKKGYVHAAEKQTPGHSQGYQLINDLLNNKNKVNIEFVKNDAYTQSGQGAQGTPDKPGKGSAATVAYDPDLSIKLPALQKDGTIKDESIASSVVLAHELVHATHAQRGTIDRSIKDHTFTDGGTKYKESWRFEEFRTTGFSGFRQGTEPTENAIRAELGFNPRATYLDKSSWTPLK